MIKSTLVHQYLKNVNEYPHQIIYRFIEGDTIQSQTLNESYLKASSIAKNLLENVKQGDRALLMYMPGIEFLDAFWACQLAGIIAVPVPLTPNLKQVANFIHRTSKKCTPTILLTTSSLTSSIDAFAGKGNIHHPKKTIATDTIKISQINVENFILPTEDTIALLQYTSGSVTQPKGVIISHQNLKNNLNIIIKNTGAEAMTNGSGWLPHFHDMGLIGQFLVPAVVPGAFNFMSPLSFIETPKKWLSMLSDYKSEITVAPNFAFEYCNKKIDVNMLVGIDLSNLQVVLTGSEPIKGETLRSFAEKFESTNFNNKAFMPCYGMAESTLMISCHKKQTLFKTKVVDKSAINENKIIETNKLNSTELISCGKIDESFTVKIVNNSNESLVNGIGEIWLKGPSISKGYWNESDSINKNFNSYLVNGDGPYFKTGDLGCIIDDEIFITGRLKDVIILRGKNYYPQDVEEVVRQCNQKIKKGSVVTFGFKNKLEEEAVAVCFETKNTMDETDFETVSKNIVAKVLDECGIKIEQICLVKEKQIPKTSSGKIQRAKAKALWQKNKLDVINTYNYKANNNIIDSEILRPLIVEEVSLLSGITISKVEYDKRIFDFGIESIQLPHILDSLKKKTDLNISLQKFMNNPTINGLLMAFEQKNNSNKNVTSNNQIEIATNPNNIDTIVLPDFNLLV